MDREFLCQQGLPEEAVEAVLSEHNRVLREQSFDHALDAAITAAHGRSGKAIRALLDLDSLRESELPEQAIREALENLQSECGYLFEPSAPPYAPGAGRTPLAKRYTMEELGKLPMEQYKAYRRGR